MNVNLNYALTEAAVQAHIAATGKEPESVLTVDLETLPAESRAVIVYHPGFTSRTALKLKRPIVTDDGCLIYDKVELLPSVPTVAEWISIASTLAAEARNLAEVAKAKRQQYLADTLHKRTVAMNDPKGHWSTDNENVYPAKYIDQKLVDEASGYDDLADLVSDYIAAVKRYNDTREENLAQYRRDKEAEKARQDLEKARRAAERAEWADAHGSEHLKDVIHHGYNAIRLYCEERAAAEFPGYVLDFDNTAEHKDRTCPSPRAMEEIHALEARGIVGKVVWMTRHPTASIYDYDDDAAEAIMVQPEWTNKRLYRIFDPE